MSTSLVRSMSMIDPNLGLSNRHRQALGVQQLAAWQDALAACFGFSFVRSAFSFAILIGWITFVSIIGILEFGFSFSPKCLVVGIIVFIGHIGLPARTAFSKGFKALVTAPFVS